MQKKSTSFILSLVFTFIISTIGINFDITQFSQRKEINIPDWYFYIIFLVDILMILSLVFIFFYRKMGVIMFPIMVFLHFFLHNFYLSTFLYFDILVLFFYFLFVLMTTLPRWQSFT